MSEELHPGIFYTVFSREFRSGKPTPHDTYDTLEVAKDFADEFAGHLRHYEAWVVDAKGAEVYNTRKK